MSQDSTGWASVKLVTVRKVQGHLLAEMVKAKLESEGIPAVLRYESVGRVLGITVDGLGQVEIMVPEERAEDAKEALAEVDPESWLPEEPPTEEE